MICALTRMQRRAVRSSCSTGCRAGKTGQPPTLRARAASDACAGALRRRAAPSIVDRRSGRRRGRDADRDHDARPRPRQRRSTAQPPIWLIDALGPDEVDLVDLVAGPLGADGALDLAPRASSSAPPRINVAQVELVGGEQAGAELAVGGEAHPVAVAAERLGDRRDDADLAARRRGSASGRPAPRPGPASARAGTRRRSRRRSRPG